MPEPELFSVLKCYSKATIICDFCSVVVQKYFLNVFIKVVRQGFGFFPKKKQGSAYELSITLCLLLPR